MRFRILIYLAIFLAAMTFGTVGFSLVEGLSPADAFYFSIVTIATVGYGDIHPSTQAGKILAIFLIVVGVGSFLGVVANATEMMLNRREKKIRLEKLNMVIGVFFSEVGTKLLTVCATADANLEGIRDDLKVSVNWAEKDFFRARGNLTKYRSAIDSKRMDLDELRGFLLGKRSFLLGLLENPVMMEHEYFTDLLWAIFHFGDELAHREDLETLPATDTAHLKGDLTRAYDLLIVQWLDYMIYLKKRYPYLFSLATRTNPFDKAASPIAR